MSKELRVPVLPESVTDATILNWHRKPGDAVRQEDNLVDLETDKVVLEVPSPVDGVLREIKFADGDTVTADDLLAIIDEGAVDEAAARSSTPAPHPAARAAVQEPVAKRDTPAAEPVLTPAVRRMVKELGLDPGRITGTGKDGRILKSDVMRYLDTQEDVSEDKDVRALGATPGEAPAGDLPGGSRPEQRVPMTRLRARIAERLVEAQQNAAILTTFNEVNLQQVIDLRQRYRETFEKKHQVRLGFMGFFVKACIEALKKFPVVNASVDEADIVYHAFYDIGIAVGSPRGLVVPVLRDADLMSFAELEESIKALGTKAAEGALTYEELTGGTFTISNGGVYGSMLSTPILNPPQSAILGMHNIVQRPVVEDGEIVIRPMMYLALSYDHRIIDGREAVQFLVTVKNSLEDPARLLLQI
ncbi:MAG: 2-oxoglutarate dehydrogenase complex dihydrolipoyllysine-residue succinyltransferase [Pseudomonadota bacterium]